MKLFSPIAPVRNHKHYELSAMEQVFDNPLAEAESQPIFRVIQFKA